MISQKIHTAIREVPDFPKPGINFKDITTLLLDPILSNEIIDAFIERLKGKKIDAIVTNIGPPNVNETTSASGNSRNPRKRAIIAKAPLIALKACKPGREVL